MRPDTEEWAAVFRKNIGNLIAIPKPPVKPQPNNTTFLYGTRRQLAAPKALIFYFTSKSDTSCLKTTGY